MRKTCLCYKTSKLVPTSLITTGQNCDFCLFQSPSESLSLGFPLVTVTAFLPGIPVTNHWCLLFGPMRNHSSVWYCVIFIANERLTRWLNLFRNSISKVKCLFNPIPKHTRQSKGLKH